MAEPNIVASTTFWILRIVLLVLGGSGKKVLRRLAPALGRLNLIVEPQCAS